MLEQLIISVQIILIDIVMAADNAIIIGLIAANFAPDNRKKIIAWGVAAAFLFRIIFALGADYLFDFAWIKILGGVLLIWVINNLRQDFFGKNPHKNGYASEVKECIKKYKKVTLKSLYNTIEKINPSPSKRRQKILLYNIIEVINIHPYYTQKTEDDIAKHHSEDEFKYRKINSLLR